MCQCVACTDMAGERPRALRVQEACGTACGWQRLRATDGRLTSECGAPGSTMVEPTLCLKESSLNRNGDGSTLYRCVCAVYAAPGHYAAPMLLSLLRTAEARDLER